MKNINSLIVLLIITPFVGTGILTLIKYSGIDCLTSILLSFIIGFIYMYIYYSISKYNKELLLNGKIKSLFNKPMAYVLIIILAICALLLAFSKMYGILIYTSSQFLNNTPLIFIGVIFTLLIIYLNFQSFNTIKKLSNYIVIFNIVLTILAVIGVIPKINLDNLKPMFITDTSKLIKSSLYLLCIDILPIFVVLNLDKSLNKKNILFSYTFSYIIIMLIMFSILGTMGIYLLNYYEYPAYIVLQYVNIFNFINRVENVLNIQWILGLYISTTIFCYYITSNLNKVFKVVVPIIILIVSILLFKNTVVFNKIALLIYPYLGITIFTISLLILIKIKIGHKTYSVN